MGWYIYAGPCGSREGGQLPWCASWCLPYHARAIGTVWGNWSLQKTRQVCGPGNAALWWREWWVSRRGSHAWAQPSAHTTWGIGVGSVGGGTMLLKNKSTDGWPNQWDTEHSRSGCPLLWKPGLSVFSLKNKDSSEASRVRWGVA